MERVDNNALSAILKQPHMRRVFDLVPQPAGPPRIRVAAPEQRAQADWPRVAATLRELARLFPTNANALEPAGTGLALGGLPGEAVPLLERAAALNPNLASLRRNLGQARLDSGDPGAAVRDFERALVLDPADSLTLGALASALEKTGDFKRAADTYDRLVALEPGNAEHARRRDAARAKARP
jgi:tetratricopeptide (TPR) repeat protein